MNTRQNMKQMLPNRDGFTLLEVVVSLGILALGILGIFSLIPTGVEQNTKSKEQARAVILAQSKIEEIMAMAATDWDKFNQWNHFYFTPSSPPDLASQNIRAPYYIGPDTDIDKESWGWVKPEGGTWIDNLGYQWEWNFVKDDVSSTLKKPAGEGNLALITLTVSWPQEWSKYQGISEERDLMGFYCDPPNGDSEPATNRAPNPSHFKDKNIQYVRLISYVSKGL